MSGCWIVHDFHSGKRTFRGNPNPDLRRFDTVTVVSRGRIDDLLGTRTLPERTAVLRRLRDDAGILVCRRGKLTHNVRGGDGRRFRAYVFSVPDPAYVSLAADRIRRSDCHRR